MFNVDENGRFDDEGGVWLMKEIDKTDGNGQRRVTWLGVEQKKIKRWQTEGEQQLMYGRTGSTGDLADAVSVRQARGAKLNQSG